jgi:glycosyltransferase involved in cell wall biosynthesis
MSKISDQIGFDEDMKPLVSILIPAYNAEQWITDTIRSALAQTWPWKEIIVLDDGSTDRTLAVAKQFESDEVRVLTQPNQGAAAARNNALALSRGDYIQWLDADDLLSPEKVTHQMQRAAQTSDRRMLFSSGWGSFRFRSAKAKFIPTALWTDLDPTEWMIRKWEGNCLHMQTATWLVSRELTEAAGPWDTRLLGDDDGEYFSRVINASNMIRFVPQSRVYYRITSSNRLSYIGRSDEKMEAQFLGMKLQIGYLRAREDNDRVRAACINYLQTWLPSFYPNRPDLMQEAQQLAASLGSQLSLPKASWKYGWIEKLFGVAAAKNTQLYYNQVKSSALRVWDWMMYSFERRNRLLIVALYHYFLGHEQE